jgi:hypothetical protein
MAFTVVEVSEHTIRRLEIDLAPESATVEREPSKSSK